MPDITFRQTKIIEDFNLLNSWEEKYQFLIEKGQTLPHFDKSWQTADNLVKGCQSQVWLIMNEDPINTDIFNIYATSDAAIVRGLLALIIEVYNHQPAQEILNAKLDFLTHTGLVEHLSPTRKNGLGAMIKQIHFLSKQKLQKLN